MITAGSRQDQKTLLHAFPTFAVGGAQVRFADLANHFGQRYRHMIVSLDGRTEGVQRLGSGVDFRLIPVHAPKRSTLRNALAFRATLKALRPDVLVTYNWGSMEWGLANLWPVCPHVHIEDGFGPEEAMGQFPRRILLRRLALSRHTRVVLPSRTLHGIAAGIWGIPVPHLAYVPNGIDCGRFDQPADPRMLEHFGIAAGEPLIGTVAALRPEKNLGRLLDAFAALERPARLVIVGDGAERAGLEARARALGIDGRVVFAGHLLKPEAILPAFTLFALSSDTEQMPYSVIEAMAAGLPLAATDVGDVRHMTAPANHPFVVPRDASALAQAMRVLLDDIEARQEVGRANRDKARHDFDQERMFGAYDRLFRF